MLKHLLPWVVLSTSCIWSVTNLAAYPLALAQVETRQSDSAQTPNGLAYTFYGQQITLTERTDQIAVKFKLTPNATRSIAEPAYLRLQRDLQNSDLPATGGSPRGEAAPETQLNLEVRPLGDRYALIELPNHTRGFEDRLVQRLSQSYVEAILPVLSRPDQDESIVVTPEMVVSFEPGTSDSRARSLLARYNLEVVRPLRFSQYRYLVRSREAAGTAILAAAHQLTQIPGIQSATPNFVQSVPYQVTSLEGLATSTGNPINTVDPQPDLARLLNTEVSENSPFPNSLLPLQWHLNSRSLRPRPLTRTDIHALEAWEQGNRGQDVVVAVIDSLIQWDHPDLADNIYTVPADVPNRLPGEVNGWDFSNTDVTCDALDSENCALGDPDTRISESELAYLRPHFQNAFVLSDSELLEAYPSIVELLVWINPDLSTSEQAEIIRNWIQNDTASEFHGTWSAGVIAANPQDRQGVVGVAPDADILPIRVFGIGGEITSAALIEALGYAAARDVDVINMSLGGLLPDQALTDQIFTLLDQYPNLVIIASAGNDNLDGVSFPAAIPGVISVGATNITGNRTFYSSYGAGLDVVAPGGETTLSPTGGLLTTGGTWVEGFWAGITQPEQTWGPTFDPLGQYVQVQGTSFSAPTVSGVMALMKAQDPQRQLTREQLTEILQTSANYDKLIITQADANQYRLQASIGFGTALDFPFVRPSGITGAVEPISSEAYFFGQGLVNAAQAVEEVRGNMK